LERLVKTDVSGAFAIELPAETIAIRVDHPLFAIKDVYLPELGDPEEDARLSVVELDPGESISGRVVDAQGEPVVGAAVSDGAGRTVVSDTHGVFVLRGMRRWRKNGSLLSVVVRAAGAQTQSLVVEPGATVDIVMTPSATEQ
jgi:hypothetical protein